MAPTPPGPQASACHPGASTVFHWLLNLAIVLLLNFAAGDLADVTALAAGFVLAASVLCWAMAYARRAHGSRC